jgi:hypothetical protein
MKVVIQTIKRRIKYPLYGYQVICGLLYACGKVLNVVLVRSAHHILIPFILTYPYPLLQICGHSYKTWVL